MNCQMAILFVLGKKGKLWSYHILSIHPSILPYLSTTTPNFFYFISLPILSICYTTTLLEDRFLSTECIFTPHLLDLSACGLDQLVFNMIHRFQDSQLLASSKCDVVLSGERSRFIGTSIIIIIIIILISIIINILLIISLSSLITIVNTLFSFLLFYFF